MRGDLRVDPPLGANPRASLGSQSATVVIRRASLAAPAESASFLVPRWRPLAGGVILGRMVCPRRMERRYEFFVGVAHDQNSGIWHAKGRGRARIISPVPQQLLPRSIRSILVARKEVGGKTCSARQNAGPLESCESDPARNFSSVSQEPLLPRRDTKESTLSSGDRFVREEFEGRGWRA